MHIEIFCLFVWYLIRSFCLFCSKFSLTMCPGNLPCPQWYLHFILELLERGAWSWLVCLLMVSQAVSMIALRIVLQWVCWWLRLSRALIEYCTRSSCKWNCWCEGLSAVSFCGFHQRRYSDSHMHLCASSHSSVSLVVMAGLPLPLKRKNVIYLLL